MMSNDNDNKSISICCPPKKETSTAKGKKTKKATFFDDNDITDDDNMVNQNIEKEEESNIPETNTVTKKKKKKKKKKKSDASTSIQGMKINAFDIDDEDGEDEKRKAINNFASKKSKSQIVEDNDTFEEIDDDTEVKKKKKKKKKSIQTAEMDTIEENSEDEKTRKKKKKKKKKVEESEDEAEPYEILGEEEDVSPKKKKKKKKVEETNIEEEEPYEVLDTPKKKKKKKKKSETVVKKKDSFEELDNDDEVNTKKKKKKKKSETVVKKKDSFEELDNDEENNTKKKKKKKKSETVAKEKSSIERLNDDDDGNNKKKQKKNETEVENNNTQNIDSLKSIETYNEFDDYTDIFNSRFNKNKQNNSLSIRTNNDTIVTSRLPKNINNNTNNISKINNTNKKTNANKKPIMPSINKSIFNETKKKLGKIFFTKKKKNKNNDYIETESTSTETTIEKEKNVAEFLEKAKEITYRGYNYTIKEEDYFERKGVKIRTILNSEDAAIKKCEELCDELADKKKWFDPDFGSQPNDSRKNKESLYGEGDVPPGNPRDTNVEWYPLSDISDSAQFFSDGVESNDVIQGCLGDCWFISALSVIATKDYLLRGEFSDDILSDKKIDEEESVMLSTGIYPPIFHSFRKKGIFCFRFFKNFKWRYVLVDNRLPCNKIYNDNQIPTLLYGKCRARNEFWVPLIEKAYAKLHGSYRALASGFIDDGLVDLTGLTSKKMIIEDTLSTNKQKADELWDILIQNSTLTFNEGKQKTAGGKLVSAKFFTRNKTMMGCSVESKGNSVEMEVVLHNRHTGVLAGHAYSILDVFEIPKPRGKKRKTSRLLRIRNPWGRKEWNGKWSDDSVETKQNKERIEQKLNEKYKGTSEKINLSQEDGTFLMCFSDFRQIYNKLFICKNFPPSFIGVRIYGSWTTNESGGLPVNSTQEKTFYSNPQIYLERDIDGLVSISLLQNDGRLVEPYFPYPGTINKVCLLIFRVGSKTRVTNLNNLIDKTLIVSRRDSILELNLTRGRYIIIPSTFDSGKTGNYCLEFHFEDEVMNGSIKGQNKVECLKNSRIEKLGGNTVRYEILSEFISSQAKSSNTNREQFIIQKFKEIIKDDDDYEYGSSKKVGNFFNKDNQNYDDEDFDYI